MELGKLMQMDYGWAEVRIFDQNADMVCDAIAGPSDLDIDIQPKDVSAKDNVTLVYEINEKEPRVVSKLTNILEKMGEELSALNWGE